MNDNRPAHGFFLSEPAADKDLPHSSQAYRILVANEQSALAIDEERLVRAVQSILLDSQFSSAQISIALVDDHTIHSLNNQYLGHDYPTDVLSFVLEDSAKHLEGEVVVSSETALRVAAEVPWSPSDELLLYVIHGTLHLVGHGDKEPEDQMRMYAAEAHYLQSMCVVLPSDSQRWNRSRKEAYT